MMALIFVQFMIRHGSDMYAKFKVVIFIILLLPLLSLSSNVRKRRRPGLDEQNEDSNEAAAYPDQLALATNYRPQEYVGLSSGYSNSDEAENYHHRHHVTKPPEETNIEDPQAKFFEENLANTKTAHEYVEKALMLHGKHELTITSTVPTAAPPIKPKQNPDINLIAKASSPRYEVYEGGEQTESPVPYYEKDSVTRSSYDLFDLNENEYQRQRKPYSGYSTVRYEPVNYDHHGYDHDEESQKNEDHLQASPSEMPKEEILRHIEESVIKYMKTLEAEGKIPTQEPKIYYKIQHQSIDPIKSYSTKQKGIISQSETAFRMHHSTPSPPIKILMKEEPVYQQPNPAKEIPENISENVEFVYKIKTRSPGQKYKNQGQKQQQQQNNPGNFDHKPFQGFDLSHLVPDERPTKAKLYFNTETYRDINSLPYKPEKILVRHEHKEREQRRPPVEYKSFQNHQETGPPQYIQINDHQVNQGVVDEGYSAGNSYRFMIHKEPKHDPENGLIVQPSNWQPYNPNKEFAALQYDSYNPKFNNNPEGFGYQHNYKPPDTFAAHSIKTPVRTPKRGKRGQNHPKKPVRNFAPNKDPEANVALRPPPKNNQS